ncbi:hypothetical protein DICSQDRAFT_178709 [Dichomitus squalens LYAD-421 SS1]|uniref:uncharacterized protein n=1 Tax=Dichomitus squalens (strain LYAD-421) TaxID=732165 RepID=UPI0004411786|nr:uncharacterized protein DICSQDRAFT_178709 [Dichomitus squalens LYAD-421 SS1]EJF64223.1 hypothetical protein DICSQDRAFT_178709 [Dichomitus squalens LYAD-421 SS1]
MDDLYQNAWSETTHDTASTFKSDPRPSWSSPSKITSPFDEEADLAAPSWSTGADIRWDEPSGSPGFSWSQSDADAGWGPSTYEGITLRKPQPEVIQEEVQVEDKAEVFDERTDEAQEDPTETAAQEVNDYVPLAASPVEGASSLPSSPVQPSVSSPTLDDALSNDSPSTSFSPTLTTPTIPAPRTGSVVIETYDIAPELVAPPSPDGFGTFESGLADDTPDFIVSGADADPWGASAWDDAEPEANEEEPVVDEWERARQQRAKQDRRVPPEILANILAQTEELSREICPNPEEEQTSEQDAWRNDRRSGIEGVPGLTTFSDSFLPPLSLQPLARFAQTQLAKKVASSVKLTKNLPITRGSPMSHYLAAKGSTAWETSVKERKEVVEDDIPVGWRIVEKAPAAPATDTTKKTGGLFSFWGRRQSQVVTNASAATGTDSEPRPNSTEKPRSPVTSEVKSDSRRPSQDSVRSSMTGSVTRLPSPSKEPTSVETVPITAMSSYSTAPDPVAERSETPPAPSAVSRFLTRFSRRSGGGSPRSSLALSSDDLEFLSDIVPSARDDTDEDATDALEKFVNAKRDSVVPVLPPPLAPPPRAPPPLRPISAASNPMSAGSKLSSPANAMGNDFDMLFGSMDSMDAISPPHNMSPSSLPSLGAPFKGVGSSTPGAGPSKPPVMPALSSQPSSRPPSRLQTSTPPLEGFSLPPPPSFTPIAPSVAARPKPTLSSPFPLPPPPASSQFDAGPTSASSTSSQTSYRTAAEDSPPSPTSALPLGELYPHLMSSPSTPQRSAQPFLEGKKRSNLTSSPLATETPLASTFSKSAAPIPLLRPPSQAQNVNSAGAMPVTSNLFEDDDFSDFQSPVEQLSHSPPIPPPISKSPRTMYGAPRNMSSRSQTLPTLAPFALPPSASTVEVPVAPLKDNLAGFDDDDFSDFHSPPMSDSTSQSTSDTFLFANSVSDKALLTPKSNPSSFNGLDFFGNSLATPSPPRVPTKPAPPLQPPPLHPPAKAVTALQPPPLHPPPSSSTARAVPPLQPPPLFQRPPSQPPSASSPASATPNTPSGGASSSLLARRRSQAAEHLHTLNLLERAAAKQGQRWPAPPSPLPAIIPGPNGAPPKGPAALFDIMDDEEPPAGAAAAQPLAPSASFPLPPTLNPTRPSSGLGAIGGAASPPPALASPAPMNTDPSTSSAGTPAADPLFDAWDFGRTTSPQNGIGSAFGSGGAAKQTNGTVGGLSAQDLSFFEGL